MKPTSLLFLIAFPAAIWAQAPIDASQMPDGQIVVFNQSGLYTTGDMVTCGGAVEFLGIPNCPPTTAYTPILSSNISGNTGGNNWSLTNITNTIGSGDTSGYRNTNLVVVFIVLDPMYYSPAHSPAFFSSSSPPAYVSGPQPSSITLVDTYDPLGAFSPINLPSSAPPGNGGHWYLKLVWAPGVFTPGSTVAFRAPVFAQGSSAGGPTVTSLSPNSAPAGAPSFTMTVNGTNFVSGSSVLWNGSPLQTTFVSTTQLTAIVPAGLVASPGSASVSVLDFGGGNSNSATFSIGSTGPQAPFISSLSPNSVSAGAPSFTMTVNGQGFVSGSSVLWNGSPLSTTVVGATQLLAAVPASFIATGGSAGITVSNPGNVTSNSVIFSIIQASAGQPIISNLSPGSATPGGPGFTLTVTGAGFQSGAVVQWNGTTLSTNFQGDPTQLTASVPASLIANPGTAAVTVVNPNGKISNFAEFQIGPNGPLTLAQIADGGSWKTLFQVINLDQNPVNFAFQFWDDNGNPLALPFLNGTAGTFSGSLSPGATAFFETPGTAPGLTEGWAKITASGKIGVLAIFRQRNAGQPDSEGTVTALPSTNHVFLPFDNTNGYSTGIAIANTNPLTAQAVSLIFQTDSGAISQGSLVIPPNAHLSFALTDKFPALGGLRGSIQFTIPTPDLSIVGLRFSPTNSFTSLTAFQ